MSTFFPQKPPPPAKSRWPGGSSPILLLAIDRLVGYRPPAMPGAPSPRTGRSEQWRSSYPAAVPFLAPCPAASVDAILAARQNGPGQLAEKGIPVAIMLRGCVYNAEDKASPEPGLVFPAPPGRRPARNQAQAHRAWLADQVAGLQVRQISPGVRR